MIEAHALTKFYGSFAAARDVSFQVPRGQVVGILGPNGAGKSTTIRIIAGLLPPTSGRARVDGLDSIADTRQVRRRLGYLPESNPLYPEMLVKDFLRYRAALFAVPAKRRTRAIDHAVQRCALREVLRKRISALSKGYRQRLGLAAALLHDPPLLILDEPTSGLDPAQIAETRRLIRELAGERTMLLVSHLLPEVERTCDRVIVFARGRIRADGPPAQLTADIAGQAPCLLEVASEPNDRSRAALREALGAIEQVEGFEFTASGSDHPLRAAIRARPGVAPEALREAVGRAMLSAGLSIRELRTDAPSLETLYISLIERAESEPEPDPKTKPDPPAEARPR
ncbi:MAG: ABC transporter ATP-binding protein [Phycisphaerales bacterium]